MSDTTRSAPHKHVSLKFVVHASLLLSFLARRPLFRLPPRRSLRRRVFPSQTRGWRCLRWPSRSNLPVLWAQLVLVCGSTRVDPLTEDGTVTTTGTGLTLLILLRQAWPRQLMARFSHRSFKSLFAKFFFTESGVHDAQDKIFLLLASRQIMIHGRQERCLTFPKQLGEEGAKFCFLALGALIIVFTHGQAVSRSVRITTISVLIRRWSRFRPLLFLVLLCSLPNVTQRSPPLSTQTPNTVAARTLDTRCKTVFFADLFHGCLPEPSKTIGMHLTVILMDKHYVNTRDQQVADIHPCVTNPS